MRENRIRMLMEVEFTYGDFKDKVDVWVPFPVFINAVRDYCDIRSVTLDGTDTSIWNLLVDLECVNKFEDDEDFVKKCVELYKGTEFEEEDYEMWKDEYEFDHNLGKYAEEK